MGFGLINLYNRAASAQPKYVCDDVADLRTLPDVAIGTTAYIVNTAETYASDTNDDWHLIAVGDSSDDGSSPDGPTIVEFRQMENTVVSLQGDVTNLQQLVGETSVEQQINTAISNLELNVSNGVITSINLGATTLPVADGCVTIPIGAGLKTSEEITISEDGSLQISTIDISKIKQDAEEEIFLDGGGAS